MKFWLLGFLPNYIETLPTKWDKNDGLLHKDLLILCL